MFYNNSRSLLDGIARSSIPIRHMFASNNPRTCKSLIVRSSHHSNEYTTRPTLKLELSPVHRTRPIFKSSIRNFCSTKCLWTRHSAVLQSLSKENKGYSKDDTDTELKEDVTTNIGGGSWEEVYSGVLTTQLKLLKIFSIGTSLVGLSVQPVLYEKLGTTDLAIAVTLASMFGFFTFVTPALIHWVSKKYVTKLEYDPERDVYAATTLSFFLREKKLHFTIEDVVRPDIPGIFTSFLVKNQPLFVDPHMFENVDHYSRIMGYDKPIEFSLDRDKKFK